MLQICLPKPTLLGGTETRECIWIPNWIPTANLNTATLDQICHNSRGSILNFVGLCYALYSLTNFAWDELGCACRLKLKVYPGCIMACLRLVKKL